MANESTSKIWMLNAAARVKERRKALGLTQRQVAEFAGCHYVFVNELEKGKATLRIDKVLDVLIILGLEPKVP